MNWRRISNSTLRKLTLSVFTSEWKSMLANTIVLHDGIQYMLYLTSPMAPERYVDLIR